MEKQEFVSYEYKELNVKQAQASFYLDCYKNFGWKQDENFSPQRNGGKVMLKLKRNQKIINRTELTRLQRHFEANMEEISKMESLTTASARKWALFAGMGGTAFMAGSVFAVTAQPPVIWLCILLAIPAFAGWLSPHFIYKKIKEKNIQQTAPYIESKYEEITEICEKGYALL